MATLTQTIANRLNALKSTGPRTAEGKARSARNATTHGLSRSGALPPAGMADAIVRRKDRWRHEYRPEGPAQEWVFERLCAESVRLDACDARILAVRAEHAERAAESWDDDRAAAVAELASRLADRPEVIQPRLLQGKHGVLWLLERWDEVADTLRRCDGWTTEAWGRAMDLLGVPAAARAGSGPWDLDPEDRTSAPGLDLVRSGVEGLRERLESYLEARDARARGDAEAGLGGDESPEVRRLERYASDARRQLARCLAELRRLQSEAAPTRSAAASARPADAPPPRPVRTRPAPPPPAPPNAPAEPAPAAASPAMPSPSASSARTTPGRSPLAAVPNRLAAPSPAPNRRTRRALAAAARRG